MYRVFFSSVGSFSFLLFFVVVVVVVFVTLLETGFVGLPPTFTRGRTGLYRVRLRLYRVPSFFFTEFLRFG